MNEPDETGQMESGPSFENALRTCLVSGVILVDLEANLASLNPEARQLLGLPADQSSKVSIDVLAPEMLSLARETLASGTPSSVRQIDVALKNASNSVQVCAVPLTSISREQTVVLTIQALNPSGQFERQIRQLDRLANTGTLAAGMAHEIKNALVACRTFLDLLLEKNTDAELVEIVRSETGRIDSIVSRMLRFAGSHTTTLTSLHLHEVLDHGVRLIQPQLSQKSISLERSFRANPDLARGDEYELQQAFANLLLNALEAMSEQGKLTVVVENVSEGPENGRRLRVTIQDSGAGILPEHMEHLFEPFFTTKASGTGLGLAITRRIIQEHGGSISVQSRPGQGTTFTVLLPLVVPSGQLSEFATTTSGGKLR